MVDTLVARVFATEEHDAANALLRDLAATPHIHEVARVQVAVIKLSDGSLAALRRCIADAGADYRDVLAWAECPAVMRTPVGDLPPEGMAQLRRRDRAQYAEWLAARLASPTDPSSGT